MSRSPDFVKPTYSTAKLRIERNEDIINTPLPVYEMRVGDILEFYCPHLPLAVWLKAALTAQAVRLSKSLLYVPSEDKQIFVVVCVRTLEGVCPRAWNIAAAHPRAELLNADRNRYQLGAIKLGAKFVVTTLAFHPYLPDTGVNRKCAATVALRNYISAESRKLGFKFSVNRYNLDAIITRTA